VETTIIQFRVLWEGGYRRYAHLADISSSEVLRKMVAPDDAPTGISQALFDRTLAAYAEPANLKKIDIGGGLIHGEARDFVNDQSDKLVLAHTARKLTEDERAIGSGAPFGTIDVLIKGVSEPLRGHAFQYLREYFPDAPVYKLKHLLNSPILTFNPEVLLYKAGDSLKEVYLIVSGLAETLRPGRSGSSLVSAGSFLGETPALLGSTAEETCRAISFVQVLRMHHDVYVDFVTGGKPATELMQSLKNLDFLRSSWLFSDNVSGVTLHNVLRAAEDVTFKAGDSLPPPEKELYILKSGSAILTTPSEYAEAILPGMHFGATEVSGFEPEETRVRFESDSSAWRLPLKAIGDIPVVRWKLLETHRRRYVDN
jgi:hemerythrin